MSGGSCCIIRLRRPARSSLNGVAQRSSGAATSADASTNPVTNPVHTFHLGLWFNSPDDAAKAGCPGDVTPFNGEHNAGIQVLNTSNFADLRGPLFFVKP